MNIKNKKIIKIWKKTKKYYHLYEIIVSYKKNNNGYFIEKLGYFNPNLKKQILFINLYRLSYWLNKGIKLNKSLKKLIIKFINLYIIKI